MSVVVVHCLNSLTIFLLTVSDALSFNWGLNHLIVNRFGPNQTKLISLAQLI